jgi:hypothetical protein
VLTKLQFSIPAEGTALIASSLSSYYSPLNIAYSPRFSLQLGERLCRVLALGLHETLMHPSSKGSIMCIDTAVVRHSSSSSSKSPICYLLGNGPIDIDVAYLHQMDYSHSVITIPTDNAPPTHGIFRASCHLMHCVG